MMSDALRLSPKTLFKYELLRRVEWFEISSIFQVNRWVLHERASRTTMMQKTLRMC